MKIAMMGSGGLGGYFGARLAQAGNDVHFIARGRHYDAIRAHGLRVLSPRGDLVHEAAQVTNEPTSIGPVDLVVVAVKLWDTADAVRSILPLIGDDTAVVSFQNGVDKDDIVRDIVGPEHAIGGVSYIGAGIEEPGVIRHTGMMAKLVFGEYDGRTSARVQAFYEACMDADIDAEISPDIERSIWEKFVFLVGLSGTTALVRQTIGPIRSTPDTRELLFDAMNETVAVGRARNVGLPEDYAAARLEFVDGLPPEFNASMHHDLQRGNRLELPWLSGAVARMGRELGVATPVNRVVAAALAPYVAGKPA